MKYSVPLRIFVQQINRIPRCPLAHEFSREGIIVREDCENRADLDADHRRLEVVCKCAGEYTITLIHPIYLYVHFSFELYCSAIWITYETHFAFVASMNVPITTHRLPQPSAPAHSSPHPLVAGSHP